MMLTGCVEPPDDRPKVATEWEPEEHLDDIAGAAAVVQQQARARWPEEFAGVWIRGGAVYVGFTRGAHAKAEELRRDVPTPHRIRGVDATVSFAELRALQQEMGDDRMAVQQGNPPSGMPDAIVDTGGVYDLALDQRRGVVTVNVERVTRSLRRAFRDYYQTDVLRFEEGVAVEGG